MFRYKQIIHAAALLLSCIAITPSHAQRQEDSVFTVQVNVEGECGIVTNTLDFGTLASGQADVSNQSLAVNCSNGLPYVVRLSPGQGGFTNRQMNSGSDLLNYNIYLDSQLSQVWGDGTSGTVIRSGLGNGANQSITMFGQIPGGQLVPPGNYADNIIATVEF